MRSSRVLTTSILAAIGGGCAAHPAPAPLGNVSGQPAGAAAVVVDPAAPLGVLGLATMATRDGDAPYWIPVTEVAPVVAPTTAGLSAGQTYGVVAAGGGAVVKATAQAAATIPYGCDGGTQEMTPLAGPAVAPGLVWILPPTVPATWQPAALALAERETTPTRRRWTAGDVALELARVDDRHATVAITVGGAPAFHERAERYFMEGDDEAPLDLTAGHNPGIPVPAAVFAVGPGGPFLVVLDTSGYEGVGFDTLLVDGERTRRIEALGLSLYYCAF